MCVCVCVHLFISASYTASVHLCWTSKFPVQRSTKLIPPLLRMPVLLRTRATVYRHSMIYSLVFVKQRRFWCLYPISNYVLSGCGGNTQSPASKQKSLHVRAFGLFFCHYLFSLPLYPPLLSTPFLSSSHRTLFFSSNPTHPPSPSACQWPSSSCAWEKLTVVSPENLSERDEREAGGVETI